MSFYNPFSANCSLVKRVALSILLTGVLPSSAWASQAPVRCEDLWTHPSEPPAVRSVAERAAPTAFNRHGIGGNFPPELMEDALNSEAPPPRDVVRAKITTGENTKITKGNFEQKRGVLEVMGFDMPYLAGALLKLPSGSLVMDGGSGFGTTIGSIVDPDHTAGNNSNPREQRHHWAAWASGLSHLKFLGVSASDPVKMQIPLKGPRHAILAGRFFSQHTAKEIISQFHQKIAAYFDDIGIFAYTTTPNKDLELLHQISEPGAAIFIRWEERHAFDYGAYFQLPDGRFINFEGFIRKYAADAFDVVQGDHEWAGRVLELRVKKTAHELKLPQIEYLYTKGHQPGARYFRVTEGAATQRENENNDLQAWRETRPDSHFVFQATHDGYKWTPEIRREFLLSQETIFSSHLTSTVRREAPFTYAQLIALYLEGDDFQATDAFAERHRKDIVTGTSFDLLTQSLFDLKAGLRVSKSLNRLRAELSRPLSGRNLLEDAAAQRSPFPFSLKSFFSSVMEEVSGKDAFVLVKDGGGSPDLYRWRSILASKLRQDGVESDLAVSDEMSHTEKATDSAVVFLSIMKRAWATSPQAKSWLKEAAPEI